MQSTINPAAAGNSDSRREFTGMRHPAFYATVISLVAGSLLCNGTVIQAQDAPPAAAGTGQTASAEASPAPVMPKAYKNEVGATADFMFGQGTITLPIGYALNKALPGGNLQPQVVTANRSTVYYGGTVSYSYGRSWYLDFSYENGTSTGSQRFDINNTLFGPGQTGHFNANFDYNDDWYQIYLRYNFQNLLAGTRFKAYLRGGVSLVDATLTANDSSAPSLYQQHDDTTDVMGNLGFGLTYTVYSTPRFKVGLQVEGEGSFGMRSQDSTETLPQDVGLGATHATLNNDLYGGIGRGTIHADWRVGHSGRWRVTGDVGIQAKYTIITYSSGGGSPDEYLWGPYVKIGASYVF